MLALSIRQPYVELILRGMKTIEYRSRPTRIIGERFWIYASKKGAGGRGQGEVRRANATSIVADNLAVESPPPWMVELANGLRLFSHELPTGVIVGSAVIEKVTKVDSPWSIVNSMKIEPGSGLSTLYQWHLTDVRRMKTPRKPVGHPQPVWFKPF